MKTRLVSALGIIVLIAAGLAIFWEQLPIRLVLPYIVQSPVEMGGSVETVTFEGDAAGEQTYHIYLPTGYEASDDQYPVLYHLHGAFVRESWARYDCDNIGAAMERAVDKGIVEPMIVVCLVDPDGDRMWSDSYDNQYLASSALISDLIPHVDATYRTIPERSGRALQGFSMGGFGAVTNGYRAPELFSAVLIWDGALHNWDTLSSSRKSIADKMFASADYFDGWSPWTLTEVSAETDPDLFMVVGEMAQTTEFASRFVPHLQSAGHEFEYHDVACPHSLFCILDELGDDGFKFIAASFARNS